jgi:hypothetical protein
MSIAAVISHFTGVLLRGFANSRVATRIKINQSPELYTTFYKALEARYSRNEREEAADKHVIAKKRNSD